VPKNTKEPTLHQPRNGINRPSLQVERKVFHSFSTSKKIRLIQRIQADKTEVFVVQAACLSTQYVS
jgi:hypothetical protein